MDNSKQDVDWGVLRSIVRIYLPPQKRWVIAGVLVGVIAAISSSFGLPMMIQYIFPVVFGQAPLPAPVQAWLETKFAPEDIPTITLWGAVAFIPLVMMLRGVSTYFNTYWLAIAGTRALTQVRCDLFARLQWLSFSYHDRHRRGNIMTLVLQYTQSIQSGMMSILNDLVIQPLTLLAAVSYVVFAALTNRESAILLGNMLIVVGVVPLTRWVGKQMVKQMRKALVGMDAITSTVEETFSAQREVRAFNLEERQKQLLRRYIRRFNKLLLKIAAWQQALGPAIEIVSALALSYALYRGCSDGLTLEQFSALAMAFFFCYDPIKKLGNIENQCRMLTVCAQAISKLLNAEDETPEPESPLSLPQPVQGAVNFNHVTFGYNEETPVLKDVSVQVPAGQVVALVGPSGSGKTTFINLICRFYDVNEGAVEIDGVDVRRLLRTERTSAIGLVSQFAVLFNASIMENIGVGKPGATEEEIRQAAQKACVSDFAENYADGYRHVLTEGGGGLSGGQRQRVSIARAFLKNAPILILDEATSALDMKSEAMIQASLEQLAAGHTTFVIAHRFSTIRMAQRILVFEEGRIIADGTHDTLYDSCVLYRHLYDEQCRQAAESKEKAQA